jgi:hypothetical protein
MIGVAFRYRFASLRHPVTGVKDRGRLPMAFGLHAESASESARRH